VASENGLATVVIRVNGAELPNALYSLIVAVRVEESVHLPDLFTVRFEDASFSLFDENRFTIGTKIEVSLGVTQAPVVVTRGEVTAVEASHSNTGPRELVVTGMDLTHRLARGPQTRSFVKMSVSDIATQIARSHGLAAVVDSTGTAVDHVLQAAQTDLEFLRDLAVRIGFDLWVIDRTLHFKRRPSSKVRPQTVEWGKDLLDFSARFSSVEHCDKVEVTSWDPVEKSLVRGSATEPDYGATAPAAIDAARAAKGTFGQVVRRAGHVPVQAQSGADAYAASLMRSASGAEVILRGLTVGNPMIAAGAQIELTEVGRRLAGRYRVTAVEHDFDGRKQGTNAYTTRFVCGARDASELADLLGGRSGGLARDDGRALAVGLVTSNADPEKLGRVKVKLPALSQQDETTWARVVTPGGGKQRGMQWLPEVNDEVLVGFELGDRSRPYVLGGLFNRKDPPPVPDAARDGATMQRALTSRAGHQLLFDDSDKAAIELALNGDKSSLRLAVDESSLTAEKKLTVNGAIIEINAAEKLVLKAPRIEITATGNLKATGKPIELN
jgi:uncharacterized protein involved in type VI secretion and phage assembly